MDVYFENRTSRYNCCVTPSTYLLTVDHATESLCAIFFLLMYYVDELLLTLSEFLCKSAQIFIVFVCRIFERQLLVILPSSLPQAYLYHGDESA